MNLLNGCTTYAPMGREFNFSPWQLVMLVSPREKSIRIFLTTIRIPVKGGVTHVVQQQRTHQTTGYHSGPWCHRTDTTTHRGANDIDTPPQHTEALDRTRQWALLTPPPGGEAPGTASLTGSKQTSASATSTQNGAAGRTWAPGRVAWIHPPSRIRSPS